jgi:hypothetical protein
MIVLPCWLQLARQAYSLKNKFGGSLLVQGMYSNISHAFVLALYVQRL